MLPICSSSSITAPKRPRKCSKSFLSSKKSAKPAPIVQIPNLEGHAMTESAQGLLLLDKPFGVTSFDCVHHVRRRLNVKRVGHCGTLDPAARGLLMVLVGPATRTQDSFLGLEKEYAFKAEFGRKTSTADLEGGIID